MTRRAFTLIEMLIASSIAVFVFAALSIVYFMSLNYYRTILAETLQPTTARQIRDRLCFRLADSTGRPVGLGLLSFSDGQIAAYRLGGEKPSVKPAALGSVALAAELAFENGWADLCTIASRSSVTNALRFSPRGVLQGGTNNRCEFPIYLTPFGTSQPMATTDGTSRDSYGETAAKSRPDEKGAVL